MKDFYKITYNKDLDYPQGYYSFGINTGIKINKPDTAILFTKGFMSASGVFTQNRFRSSSVDWCIKNLNNRIKCIAVFSGNANACTGKNGLISLNKISASLAEIFKCNPKNILLMFTGVIGQPFPFQKVIKNIQILHNKQLFIKDKYINKIPFSKAILTTDLVEKKASFSFHLPEGDVRISGCVKGSGMIYPNMSTMLAFITTNASLKKDYQDKLLAEVTSNTFNSISVDGHTSPNDSFFLFSDPVSGIKITSKESKLKFKKGLEIVSAYLAKSIIHDGEGATKFITVNVKNARSKKDADVIAREISNSALVKTAFFGSDPNWGRIISAAGNTDAYIIPGRTELYIGKYLIFKNLGYVDKNIKNINKYFKKKNIDITLILNTGKKSSCFYTCDFSYDYIKINSEYTS